MRLVRGGRAGSLDPIADLLLGRLLGVVEQASALRGLHERLDRASQGVRVGLGRLFGVGDAAGDQDLGVVTAEFGNPASQGGLLLPLP